MNINLMEGWKVKSDKYQYILINERKGREHIEGFYPTLKGCLLGFVDQKIKDCDATSIHSLLSYLKGLELALNKTLHPLNISVEIGKDNG